MGWWGKRILMASTRAIDSVKDIIDTDGIRENADKAFIPFYDVDAVAVAKRGCHPE